VYQEKTMDYCDKLHKCTSWWCNVV